MLNIHDFGKQLLAEIMNSPDIRKDGDVRGVFVTSRKLGRSLSLLLAGRLI